MSKKLPKPSLEFNNKIALAIARGLHEYKYEPELPQRALDDVKNNVTNLLRLPESPFPVETTEVVIVSHEEGIDIRFEDRESSEI